MFEVVHCPRCGALVSGRICDACGASLDRGLSRVSDEVIDVHAEPVGEDRPSPEYCDGGYEPRPPEPPYEQPSFRSRYGRMPGGGRFYTFRMDRRDAQGPGCCCSVGCLFLLLFLGTLLRGCLSLF